MTNNLPLVTIGIPTFNRVQKLQKAIESALNQNYPNIEVIVSDNASVDQTENICRTFAQGDSRFQYFRHSEKIGIDKNFNTVLKNASGEYFMWLGDDDWIDDDYVQICMNELMNNLNLALVSGKSKYYRDGTYQSEDKGFNLLEPAWWLRVIKYYFYVGDNGMFYGIMRTKQLQVVNIPIIIGGDWHLLAEMISIGQAKVIQSTAIHRERSKNNATYQSMVSHLGLPTLQAKYPFIFVAIGALSQMKTGYHYKQRSILGRLFLAPWVFVINLFHRQIKWLTNRFTC